MHNQQGKAGGHTSPGIDNSGRALATASKNETWCKKIEDPKYFVFSVLTNFQSPLHPITPSLPWPSICSNIIDSIARPNSSEESR